VTRCEVGRFLKHPATDLVVKSVRSYDGGREHDWLLPSGQVERHRLRAMLDNGWLPKSGTAESGAS
jgi:hypothetical protein